MYPIGPTKLPQLVDNQEERGNDGGTGIHTIKPLTVVDILYFSKEVKKILQQHNMTMQRQPPGLWHLGGKFKKTGTKFLFENYENLLIQLI